ETLGNPLKGVVAHTPLRGYDHSQNERRLISNADDFMKAGCLHCGSLLLSCALALFAGSRAAGQSTNRGVWCWGAPAPYGLNYIIGTNALQNAAVAQFKSWGISHVYGFYGTQLQTALGKAALAAWNTLLNNNGIESQMVISDYTLAAGDNNFILEMIN